MMDDSTHPDGDGRSPADEFVSYLYGEVTKRSIYVINGCGQSQEEIDEEWIKYQEDTYGKGKYTKKALSAYGKRVEQGGNFRAFDCSGLGSYWLIQKGVYDRKKKAEAMYDDTTRISFADLRKGDWVFRITENKITHIGYMVSQSYVIHAKGRDYGVVYEPFVPEDWDLARRPKSYIYGE